MLKIGHSVTRPGKNLGDPPVTIRVPQELETVPGIPLRLEEVGWYSREYPLESHNVENRAYRQWVDTISDIRGLRKEHERLNRDNVVRARASADIEPTVKPAPGEDVSEAVKQKAREMGFNEVGITSFDLQYVYHSKRDRVRLDLPHAICLAMEQPYDPTQTIPSGPAEAAALATYRREGEAVLRLAEFIRSLGYHTQVHSPNDATAAAIAMFVQAGLGQLGACGYLLTPHVGSRCRLCMITTDALVAYDQPIDYGIHRFCQICQVCVNRCPGRALQKDKVWWRGAEKNKVLAKRCRPVMARYAACAICMKVCPIQKYGMAAVMDHYARTGAVLGKGTEELEGYTLPDKGHFGPGELPQFDSEFFHIPEGRLEEWVLHRLRERVTTGDGGDDAQLAQEYGSRLLRALRRPADFMEELYFMPAVAGTLPSREYFTKEPEFEEDL